ncbi:hypothetical protein ACU6U9_02525 [Pseudomonas sp. HK3]
MRSQDLYVEQEQEQEQEQENFNQVAFVKALLTQIPAGNTLILQGGEIDGLISFIGPKTGEESG